MITPRSGWLPSLVWVIPLIAALIGVALVIKSIADVPTQFLDVAATKGASQWQLVRHVLVPSALTWIFSSLQTSLGFAMVGAVVGEYLGATRGLGLRVVEVVGRRDVHHVDTRVGQHRLEAVVGRR